MKDELDHKIAHKNIYRKKKPKLNVDQIYLWTRKFSVVWKTRCSALILSLGQADGGRGVRCLAHHVEGIRTAQETRRFDGRVEARVAPVVADDRVGEGGDVVERQVDGTVTRVHERSVFEQLQRIVENEIVVVAVTWHQDWVLKYNKNIVTLRLNFSNRKSISIRNYSGKIKQILTWWLTQEELQLRKYLLPAQNKI